MRTKDVVHVTAMHDMEQHRDIYKITSGDSALGLNNVTISADNGTVAVNTEEVRIHVGGSLNQFTSGILCFSGPPCGIIFSENSEKISSH